MSRTVVLSCLLAASALLVVAGVALLSVPAALIVGGLLLAGWSALVLVEVRP